MCHRSHILVYKTSDGVSRAKIDLTYLGNLRKVNPFNSIMFLKPYLNNFFIVSGHIILLKVATAIREYP